MSLVNPDFDYAQPDSHTERSRRVFKMSFLLFPVYINSGFDDFKQVEIR
jgi:hypothetical protein